MVNLLSILQSQFGAATTALCDLKSTCCPSKFEVIDFDEVKKAFCAEFLIPEHALLSSADGLYIDEANKMVCFIEMKDVNLFLAAKLPPHVYAASPTESKTDDDAADASAPTFDFKQFQKDFDLWLDDKSRNLRLKVADSIFIATAVLAKHSPSQADVIEFLDKNQVSIRYIALLGVPSKYFIRYRLENLRTRLAHGMLTGKQCIPAVIRAASFDAYAASQGWISGTAA